MLLLLIAPSKVMVTICGTRLQLVLLGHKSPGTCGYDANSQYVQSARGYKLQAVNQMYQLNVFAIVYSVSK